MEFAELIKTPKVDNVILHRPPLIDPTQVLVCITSHHLILSSRSSKDDELWILHMMVDTLERQEVRNVLFIRCKNLRVFQLEFTNLNDLNSVADSIDRLSNLDDSRLLYPFYHRPLIDIIEDGWQTFELEREYKKMIQNSNDWRLSDANRGYSLCASYPEKVVVPKLITDESLIKIAKFRCLGRFPILSYIHRPNDAVIVRSGQPMIGISNKRCKDDERLLNTIIGNKRGYIIETRSQNLAQQAKTQGGGYEPETHYPLLRRVHRPIAPYHALGIPLVKLVEACNQKNCTTEKWLSRLESSNWLSHICDVLNCACLVSQCIDHEGASVLVHGWEGLDSTLQVCSLAQIILDPDCRTVQGFQALIEREWLQGGHPFSTRCKYSAFPQVVLIGPDKPEHSPVFLMFMDCVWQILQQFPLSFEFNEDFLVFLTDHAYASEYGTFLYNSPKERIENQVSQRTTSLWTYINRPQVLPEFLNPFYEPNSDAIWPSIAPQSILLWESKFLRWVCDRKPLEKMKKQSELVKARQRELRCQSDKLQEKLESMSLVQ